MTSLAVRDRTTTAAGPRLDIDLDAVARNTRLLTDRAAGEVMAVVKADGFGHGAIDVARTALAHGATRLGVTSLDEAWPLRDAGLGVPLLSWLNPVDADYALAAERDVDVAVPSAQHLSAVAAAPGRSRVHLHLDTGMARDGADPATWGSLCRAARRAEQRGELEVVGVMGHLGCADDPDDECNALGRTRFAWALETARAAGLRPRDRHLAATAATLTDPRSHHTMSRVGAGLVGIDPSGTTRLHPAMTLTAPVAQVRRVRGGTPVGYGHSHRTAAATHLGLVPLGYADGLPRLASGRAEVLVRGVRRRVVGRISMDQLVVDLGERGVDPGETVTVFGPGTHGEPTVAEWATWAGTIEHEVVTGIGARVERRTLAVPHLRSLS
ncbi:alanine racemase [Nocardioides sp. Root1257]|uniref:alanine racemase n=1 Tax=unclassified Nocardioides TaxID=2615069 RepID=UPI0006FEF35C|nr:MULTISPECIES: alanine racemase [unclassified Nocardioides]KQW42990.1 alanine racemase [Nocardioides sp. Root1257]KRC41859.1 alanine racemase [Nocardioides sp. Root224]